MEHRSTARIRTRGPARTQASTLIAVLALALVLTALEPAGPGEAARAQDASSNPDAAPALTLAQAVMLAREHNPAIGQSRAEHEAARQAGREASLSRFPSLALRETAVRTDSPADAFGLQLMQERFSFPAFMAGDPNRPDPLNNFTTQVEATMPLFTGGQLSNGIRQAGSMARAAAAMEEHTAAAVDLGVTAAYFGALLAQRFEDLAGKARETTARHVQKAQDFLAAGMLVESDALAAQVQLAKMDQNLIAAHNGAILARVGLNMAMGVDEDRPAHLEEPPALPDSNLPSLDAALEQARRLRKDLQAVENKVQAAGAGIGRAQGECWPQIGAAARYSWNDDRFGGTHGGSYTLAAMAQWQLWNWGATQARVQRSRSEYRSALESQRAYGQQVEFQVRSAWQAVEEARAGHEVSLGAVRAAEKALAIREDRFNQGLAGMTDLLDAETMAHEARVREAQTRYDLQKALCSLRFAIGLPPIPEVQS